MPARATGLVVLAVLALPAAGCSESASTSCPGVPVDRFTFTVSDPGGTRPFCAKIPAEGTMVVGTFDGTLSQDLGLGTAALCLPGELAEPYFGRVEDGVYDLSSSGGLAVLEVCGSNCSTYGTLGVVGTIDGTGAFAGTFTESFGYASGDCGTCVFPCEATYDLAGAR